MPIVEASGLEKRYGEVCALDGLDLVAESGRVTALLGPNGAGKTTFVGAVATLVRPSAGSLRIGGVDVEADPRAVRRMIGLAGQFASVEPAMTGRENLEMVGRLFGLDHRRAKAAAGEVLERLELVDVGDRLVRTYSGGLRRRLDLGASLVGRPRLLLLDEPSTGLDPASRRALWDAIRSLVDAGTDVLLTTQYLEEADQLARDIIIVDRGKVIASGTPDELKRSAGDEVLEVRIRKSSDLPAVADVVAGISLRDVRVDRDTLRVAAAVDDGAGRLVSLLRALDERNIGVDDIALRRPTLDEVFIALTGDPATAHSEENAA